jgi:predicted transcriptional regulator
MITRILRWFTKRRLQRRYSVLRHMDDLTYCNGRVLCIRVGLAYATFYPYMRQLEDSGYIRHKALMDADGPYRVYRLTDKGVQFVRAWQAEHAGARARRRRTDHERRAP